MRRNKLIDNSDSRLSRSIRDLNIWSSFLVALLIFGFMHMAYDLAYGQENGVPVEFSAAEIRIETNSSDGDAGLQIFFDGEPWQRVRVTGPDGRQVYAVSNRNILRGLGSTELFMESNEPNFEEVSLPEILAFIPEGEYNFNGITIEAANMEGSAILTHDLPCGPELTFPEEEQIIDPEIPLVIAWDPVTNKLNNETGECGEETNIQIIGYQVIVDNEDSEIQQRFDIKLPADATTVSVPTEFIVPNTAYKFEVLAIEASGNQTISESNFMTSN